MASDLSSNCTDSLSKFDEREEGEISLEDVSSSEEGQPANSLSRLGDLYRCDHCASTNQCTPWCPYHSNYYKSHNKRDIAYGKENRQLSRESGNLGGKHASSTLQEKNDDLVPISSDSELEVIGHDNGTDVCKNSKRPRKKKRKRKAYKDLDRSNPMIVNDDSTDDIIEPVEPKLVAKNELPRLRKVEVHRPREISPKRHKSPLSKVRRKRPSCSSSKMVRRVRPRESRTNHPGIREAEAKNYNYKLLKKVKRLDSSKSQKTTPQTEKQRGLSLKDKLHNMINKTNDHSKDKENVDLKRKGETDDEDELRLRQLALQTKPARVDEEVSKVASSNEEEEDDEDSEALKLRLIALKSAIQKKYQRKDKRLKNKLDRTRPDSPFDNLLAQSDLNVQETDEKSNATHEKNCLEDMDLDTDIEREKEKGEDGDSPYSPSDNLNRRLSLERELLGIDPSDVCYLENKSSSAKESSVYYDDPNSSPYCPSEPISNSCDFSPSSPTSSYHLSNDLESDRDVLSPTGSLLNLNSFEVEPTSLQNSKTQDEAHSLPLSPPPAPPPICTITNLLGASFVDDLEKDLDGSPLVPIDEVSPSNKLDQTSLPCDNHSSLPSLNLMTEPVIAHTVQQFIDPPVVQLNNSCRKSVKKYRASLLKSVDKVRANLKPVPLTSIPPSDITVPVRPNANNEAVTQTTEVGKDTAQTEPTRKRERKGDDDGEPSIKVARKSDKENPTTGVERPTSANPQRKVSADEDELMLREMLIASMGKRKTDPQLGHSKVIIPDAKPGEKKAPEPPSTKVTTTAQVINRTVLPPTRTVIVTKEAKSQISKPSSSTGLAGKAHVSTVAKKRTDLVNPNRYVTKKPVRSTAFPSSAMSNVVNKVNKSVELGPAKKVNLQKVSVTFNTQSAINPAMRKVNIKDNSSMLSPLNDLSEFVIKVSEDSNSDFSEDEAPATAGKIERPPLKIPKSEFEKRIDTFLREVRMNSENNKAKKPAVTPIKPKKVSETAMSTPAAVRHLSASKQEEYRRLKQQILEREKKLQKTSNTPAQSASKVNPKLVQTKSSTLVLKSTPATKPNTASKSDNFESEKTVPKANQSEVIAYTKEIFSMGVTIGFKPIEVLDEPMNPTGLKEKEASNVEPCEPGKGTKDATSSEVSLQDVKLVEKTNDKEVVEHLESDGILNNKDDTAETSEAQEKLVSSEISQPNENVQIVSEKDIDKSREESSINVPDEETTNVESTTETKIVDIEIMNGSTVNVIEMISEQPPDEVECTSPKVAEEKKEDDKRGGVLKVLSIPELNSRLEHNQCDISPPLRTEREVDDDRSENDSVIIVKDSENTESRKSPQNDNSDTRDLAKCTSETNVARNDRREIHRELQQMASLPSKEQQEQLLNMEKDLVSTRYSFLDDLTKLEQVYRQWELEKEEQQNLSKEIKELRLKLKLAEEKFQKQKTRLGEMNASAATCHDKVNHGREEYNKLSRICNGLGHRLHGSNYKIPAAGAPLVSNKLKVVAAYSEKFYSSKGEKQFKEKTDKKPSSMINPYAKKQVASETEASRVAGITSVRSSESNDKDDRYVANESAEPRLQSESQSCQDDETDLNTRLSGSDTDRLQKEQIKKPSKENAITNDSPRPYESCLSHLKDTRTTAVDGILCPFELRGTCNDTECQFVHHPNKC